MDVQGLLLAAGAGRRMGRPKALVEDWLTRSIAVLREGGCVGVTVVLGAQAAQAQALLGALDVEVIIAEDWDDGMGASLRAGLAALAVRPGSAAALVHLVDVPDVGAEVVARVLECAVDSASLARAAYDGTPGHPVLLGREHWAGVTASARGDRGARAYLGSHPVQSVECGDLAGGQDIDVPEEVT